MRRTTYVVLAVQALAVSFLAAAATSLTSLEDPAPQITATASPTHRPLDRTQAEMLLDLRALLTIASGAPASGEPAGTASPATTASSANANPALAHTGPGIDLETTPPVPSPYDPKHVAASESTEPDNAYDDENVAAVAAARHRARRIRDEWLAVMLCLSGNDNYCVMGNDSSFWAAESGLATRPEAAIAEIVADQGGYIALCLRGTLTTFEATTWDESRLAWNVNIRHIDTSRSLAGTQLDEFNHGDVIWLGAMRELPVAPDRKIIDHQNTELGLDDFNDGKKMWRGAPAPE